MRLAPFSSQLVPLDAPPVSFGNLVLGKRCEEAGGRPRLLVGAVSELKPGLLDSRQTQFVEDEGEALGVDGVLFALAATARHALAGGEPPDLIVGHGVLGRLLARLTIAMGAPAPKVWDNQACRRTGAQGYEVIAPKDDARRDYHAIYDVSGFADGLDTLIGKLAKGGEIVLAGFYANRLNFAFAPAFQAEARLRVAAEWQPEDLAATGALIESGALDLGGLISHIRPAEEARKAYPTALTDPECLKMVLDWSEAA